MKLQLTQADIFLLYHLGSSATLEFLCELQYQSDEIRSQLDSLVGMQLLQKEWDTESRIVTLIFNVVFAPSKPMR